MMIKTEIFGGLGIMYMLTVATMLVVLIAMGVDLVFGWRKAKIRGEAHSSYAFSRSLTKFMLYEGVLVMATCMDTLIHFAWWQFSTDTHYLIPLITHAFGFVLWAVEVWSRREEAEKKERARADEIVKLALKIVKDEDWIKKQIKGKEKNDEE